jgi:CheY-like chemotaxis protein
MRKIRFDAAINGKIGYEMFKKCFEKTCCNTRYLTVITDINMAVMGGLESAELMLAFKKNYIQTSLGDHDFVKDDVPIIAMSAYDVEFIHQKFEKSGIVDFISKPFAQAKFNYLLKKYYHKEDTDGEDCFKRAAKSYSPTPGSGQAINMLQSSPGPF